MKRVLLLGLLVVGCKCAVAKPATRSNDIKGFGPGAAMQVKFSDDLKFDHDQAVVCVFLQARGMMVCMSPEEFKVRAGAADD
jgi:hypothetical protein